MTPAGVTGEFDKPGEQFEERERRRQLKLGWNIVLAR